MCMIEIPLIDEVSMSHYDEASKKSMKLYHRSLDLRLCMEKVMEKIIEPIIFSDCDIKDLYYNKKDKKPRKPKLYEKFEKLKTYMDSSIIDELHELRLIGNEGVHKGIEAELKELDIEKCLDIVLNFSLEIFIAVFEKEGFYNPSGSWTPTVFSTLPPSYRIIILEKYIEKNKIEKKDEPIILIDKLSMAYLKNNEYEKALNFLQLVFLKEEIDLGQYNDLREKLQMLNNNIDKFNISRNLEDAKENFKGVLYGIKENERDGFIVLMSIIFNIDNIKNSKNIKIDEKFYKCLVAVKNYKRLEKNYIAIKESKKNEMNLSDTDFLIDKFGNKYEIKYSERDSDMLYIEQTGRTIDICISPVFLMDKLDIFKGCKSNKCNLINPINFTQFNNITVLELDIRKNS